MTAKRQIELPSNFDEIIQKTLADAHDAITVASSLPRMKAIKIFYEEESIHQRYAYILSIAQKGSLNEEFVNTFLNFKRLSKEQLADFSATGSVSVEHSTRNSLSAALKKQVLAKEKSQKKATSELLKFDKKILNDAKKTIPIIQSTLQSHNLPIQFDLLINSLALHAGLAKCMSDIGEAYAAAVLLGTCTAELSGIKRFPDYVFNSEIENRIGSIATFIGAKREYFDKKEIATRKGGITKGLNGVEKKKLITDLYLSQPDLHKFTGSEAATRLLRRHENLPYKHREISALINKIKDQKK